MNPLHRITMTALAIALGFSPGVAIAGDMPNGQHYNLNIIAVPKNNRPDHSNPSQRHTIFAPLNTVKGNVDCRILLTNGGTTFDFQVVDGFCLDGDASFILPNPDRMVTAPRSTRFGSPSPVSRAAGRTLPRVRSMP